MNQYCKEKGLDSQKLPSHVGIIMDGNGRWARQRFLPRIMGHRKGVDRVREITEISAKLGLQALTLFAFSDENWKRPADEIGGLMGLLRTYICAEGQKLIDNNVRVRVIGDLDRMESDIRNLILGLQDKTAHNTGLALNIALSYGGRREIVRAACRLFERIQRGELTLNDVTPEEFEKNLDTAGVPNVDLLIRTSGEYRVSNFLLWQIAYAEMVFEERFWPDFDEKIYIDILKKYAKRERRFGMTTEQISQTDPQSLKV